MRRFPALFLLSIATFPVLFPSAFAQTPQATAETKAPPTPAWIEKSDSYTKMLLDVQLQHSPESGSSEGLVQFDPLISDPTLADQKKARKELEAVQAKIIAQQSKETDKNVAEDLEILRKALDLQFRQEDFDLAHDVDFLNASQYAFSGLRGLLDDQVAPERRPAALIRLRKYAGTEPGYKPITELLKQRELEQIAKPGVLYPSKGELETELGRDSFYVEGIPMLFKKYNLTGWEEPYAALKTQLTEYDAWVTATILPKARTDFKLAPEEYALNLEAFGVDIPPAKLAEMAHAAFTQIQAQMAPLAAQIAKQNGYPSSDYRAVILELKKKQITGEAILPFYQARLAAIEKIIAAQNIVTLPNRPAIIRLASAAETAQQPAPHMKPPPFLNNTGQRGEFILPLNIPSATGGDEDKYDDFTYDAIGWTLTSHEVRPGHELQFDSMVEHGVSQARALYAFNSTNVEGWGLYSEYVMQPYEPIEGQLGTLEGRLQRAARAFLDPELQSGKITPAQASEFMEKDVVMSRALAKEEVERFTYRAPGQANSYFYGFTKLLQLRKDTEAALGAKFDQKKFHDFILAQGLLPPALMRKAVEEDFIPSQK